jgi:glycogen debranching enzyme
VNLQLNCKTVIHYGHAWAPGDDEQRIGRIDRINGQIARELEFDSSSELRILYPFLAKTHDELALKTFLKNKMEVAKTLDKLKEVNEELYQREDNELSQVSIEQFLQKTVESNLDSIKDPFPAFPCNFD